MIESFGFQATEAQCAIEAKPPVQWNKGYFSFVTFEMIDLDIFRLICFYRSCIDLYLENGIWR